MHIRDVTHLQYQDADMSTECGLFTEEGGEGGCLCRGGEVYSAEGKRGSDAGEGPVREEGSVLGR
jgi:hypothetical protein